MTGVAALRCPRVASTLPTPIHVIVRVPLLPSVRTVSPTARFSTLISPLGVSILVPGPKHSVVNSVVPSIVVEWKVPRSPTKVSVTGELPLSVTLVTPSL